MSLKDKLASKLSNKYHKPGESASIVPSWGVRDSIPMIEGQTSAGTFTRLILILALLAIPCLISLDTYATPSSLTISVTSGQDPTVNIPPTAAGIFAESGATTFNVSTTHAAGYSVVSSATALSDNDSNNNGPYTIPSHNIAAGIKASDYSDDAYASANNLNNTWGFKPSKHRSGSTTINNTGDSAVFLPAPISSSRTLDEVADATNNTYDIAMGTRIDHNTPISSYSSTITVTVTANPTPYAITYNKNTTDTVNNMPSNHTTSDAGTAGETVTLPSTTPTRTGFSFNGWCTTTPTTSNGVDSCSGTTYSAGGTWTINQTSSTNSLTLYAMWNRNSYDVKVNFAGSGVSSVVFTAAGYTTRTVSSSGGTASLMYGVQYTATMNFSSTSYTFDKWALNSTSYGTLGSTSANPTTFTPNTSSASAVITATGKSSKTYMQDLTKTQCQSRALSGNITVYDRRDESDYTVRYINGNCWMTQNLRITGTISATYSNFSGSNFNTKVSDLTAGSSYTEARSHVASSTDKGAWYNYCAASAGQVCSQTKISATQDICPSGWKLPTYNQQDGITSYTSAYAPIYGGYYVNGKLNNTTTYGFWWSSTAYNANLQYYLYFYNGGLNAFNQSKDVGSYIRCVHS